MTVDHENFDSPRTAARADDASQEDLPRGEDVAVSPSVSDLDAVSQRPESVPATAFTGTWPSPFGFSGSETQTFHQNQLSQAFSQAPSLTATGSDLFANYAIRTNLLIHNVPRITSGIMQGRT